MHGKGIVAGRRSPGHPAWWQTYFICPDVHLDILKSWATSIWDMDEDQTGRISLSSLARQAASHTLDFAEYYAQLIVCLVKSHPCTTVLQPQ